MSSFNIKSTVIANRDAVPKALTDPYLAVGDNRAVVGIERVPQTADIGSQVRLVTVPSNARVHSLEYCAAPLGTSSLDIAVWYPTTVPRGAGITTTLAGTLISSSVYAAAIGGVDNGVGWTDGIGTIAQASVQKRAQMLWQAVGLLSDPSIDLDVGFTVRTTNVSAGYVGMRATFVE